MYDMDDLYTLILEKYENADPAQLVDITDRWERIVHFAQRSVDEIWYDRAWPFSMATSALAMVGGSAARPSTFAGLSSEGGMWDSSGRVWQEIGYQDMVVIRARHTNTGERLFSVGATVLVPDTASTASFTLAYQATAPELTAQGTSQPVPLPYAFWQAIVLGAVALLKSESGDQRPQWGLQYQAALARQQRLWRSQATRPLRLPITVGGQW
jgi:hypothetical protein